MLFVAITVFVVVNCKIQPKTYPKTEQCNEFHWLTIQLIMAPANKAVKMWIDFSWSILLYETISLMTLPRTHYEFNFPFQRANET